MPYTRVNWVNGGEPAISAGNLNIMDKGIKDLDDINRKQTKEIANLKLYQDATKRIKNGFVFGDAFSSNTAMDMTIDLTKTHASTSLAIGATSIPVNDVTGFAVGQEITIYDDTNLERVTISAIDATAKTLTVSALAKAYKVKARVARTSAILDTTAQVLKFGGWDTSTTRNVNDAGVGIPANPTSARPQILENGWVVSVITDQTNAYVLWRVSKDGGHTWEKLATSKHSVNDGSASLVSRGTMLYTIIKNQGNYSAFFKAFDVTTTTGSESGWTTLDSTDMMDDNTTTLTINEAGTELHASWANLSTTYPNSSNIRYAKGTIASDGSITWSAVVQVTALNTSGNNLVKPHIILDGNGKPHIICDQNVTGYERIFDFTTAFDTDEVAMGSPAGWGNKVIYNGGSYVQADPDAIFVPSSMDGTTNGTIHVVWHGVDANSGGYANLIYSSSSDGGVTWSPIVKLTNSATVSSIRPSITINKNNKIFVVGARTDGTTYNIIKLSKDSGGTWSATTQVTNNTGGLHADFPITLTNYTEFSEPIFIYQDKAAPKIGFYGTWTAHSFSPLLENDVRYTLASPTTEVVSWVERDAGLTLSARVNGTAMTKSTVDNEDEFKITLSSSQTINLFFNMKRTATTDDVRVKRIIGGIV